LSNSPVAPAKPKSRAWIILKRIGLVIVTLVLAAAAVGVIYQAYGTYRDARKYPQEGRSFDLGPDFGNESLNMNCSGQGSPTVIMDTGHGVPAVGWDFVQPEVAKFTRVCSYDRAGYGWSSPGPMPRTSLQVAKELHALLAVSGEKGPYVLVAHSLGGYNVRVFTGQYPADVAGLVLVDTSHEDQISRMPPALRQTMTKVDKDLEQQRKLFPLLLFFGIARWGIEREKFPGLSDEYQEKVRYLQLQTKYIDASASEIENFDESAKEVHAAGNLGDRPLVVLTAGKNPDAKDLPKGVSMKDMEDFHEIWVNDLQLQEMHLSTKGKRVLVSDSTHMIPFERPDTIITAIREVCDAVKNKQ